MTSERWKNRIVRYEAAVDPEQLLAHPENWRCHPKVQADAMIAALDELGWVDAVRVNTHTGHVVDGHLRVGEAISRGESVPVLYVDLDVEEERKALATFDLITGLATADIPALKSLHNEVEFHHGILDTIILSVTDPRVDTPDDDVPEPDPTVAPLVWGYVQWGKKKKIDSSEAEVTLLDALYETYRHRNDGSDVGFVRWLVEGQPDDVEPPLEEAS